MQQGQNPSPGFRKHSEHTITVEPHGGHVTVRAGGRTIASSGNALLLREHTYPPVIYIPFADIDFDALSATETVTHCPFKGDASYWSVKDGPKDAMWAYQHPYDEMMQIKDHGAFYPDRVTIESGR
ncbi:MAG: DUF427 domain-containing protein [Rhizobiaceae bacterium]|nr:MAG: DUF427 domain-containing protein [Rhizobiaceae bacterium]